MFKTTVLDLKVNFLILLGACFLFFGISAASASAASSVFYSVGQTTDDLKTGTPTVTLSGGTATFSVAQTGNIGVGDVIDYDTDNKKCYISGKSTTSVWTCTTATGATPGDVTDKTVNSIKRAYTSLSSAEAGASDSNHLNNTDLTGTGADVILHFPCYYDTGADTTAVTISGWTTGASNYIKVYTPNNTSTEANVSQRHSGKWDEGKWRLSITTNNALSVSSNYVIVDGLQLTVSSAATGHRSPIAFSTLSDGDNSISVSNSLFKGGSGGAIFHGIYVTWNSYVNLKVWNNVFYNFNSTATDDGIDYNNNPGNDSYIYNNTFVNNSKGIVRSDGNIIAKNNLIKNCTTATSGTFAAGTDYNVTDNSSMGYTVTGGGNTHDRVSQTIRFADPENDDYHLHFLDTVAKDTGIDLSGDTYLPFSTDIDGHTRATMSTWDIGADEATTAIYRSVGPSASSALASGTTNAMTISGSTATFTSPLDNVIGVGDALQYDSDNDGSNTIDSIAFIYERLDSTHYIIKKADGTAPTATSANIGETNWNIYRAYTSLFNAEAGDENDSINDTVESFESWSAGKNLTTNNEQWNIACYAGEGGAADTTTVTISGWTTNSINRLKVYTPVGSLEVGVGQRHSGKWDTGKYNISVIDSTAIWISSIDFVDLDGLQVAGSGYTSNDKHVIAITYSQSEINEKKISNVIIKREVTNNAGSGILITSNMTRPKVKIWNSVIIGSGNYNWSSYNACIANSGGQLTLYNSTLETSAANSSGLSNYSGAITVAKNVYAKASTNNSYANSATLTLTNCASADGTGSAGLQNIAFDANNFTNVTTGSEDLHLPNGSALKNVGTDLSSDSVITPGMGITTDIDGQGRPTGASTWDIGADERNVNVYYSVSGGGDTSTDRRTCTDDDCITNPLIVAISGGIATFSVAQTDNIGVGDVIDYDTDNKKAYISGKIDQSNWYVTTATGDQPASSADVAVNSIKRVWGSLSSAEAGAPGASFLNSSNLTTAGVTLNIPCYYDTGADTTAVDIWGWTTGVNNYIKVYTPNNTSTEANYSQRHSGKWDDGKWSQIFSSSSDQYNFDIGTGQHVFFEGLQIKTVRTGGSNSRAILTRGSTIFYLSDSIIVGDLSGGAAARGYDSDNTTGVSYLWNNLIYDFRDGDTTNSICIEFEDSGFAYNNTVINCGWGIRRGAGNPVIKNNIAQDCVDGYYGTFATGSDYNISDLAADAPGTHSKNETTVTFADETNKDFHLASNDTAAKNAGANLRYDVNIPVTTDVDGNSRIGTNYGTNTREFDIGADQSAMAIYRSVAPEADGNMDAIDTGSSDSNQLTISNSVASFSKTVPDIVGVGDAIQYDSDNDSDIDSSDSLVFITARTDAQHYSVKKADGSTPSDMATADTDWSIFRSYTKLSYAETGTENTGIDSDLRNFDSWSSGKDIASSNQQWNIACYANTSTYEADTTAVTVNGWTTAQPDYIRVYTPVVGTEVGTSQRHQGKWDDGKYNLLSNIGVSSSVGYVRIDGLQFNYTFDASYRQVVSYAGEEDFYVSNCIIVGTNGIYTGNRGLLFLPQTTSARMYAWNNLVYGTFTGYGIANYYTKGTVYAYNNTVIGVPEGFRAPTGSVFYAKNNIAQDCANGFSGTTGFDSSSDYNISDVDQTDADDVNATFDGYKTVQFANAADNDFHLASNDTAAKDAGANLSADSYFAFSTDIDGESRATDKWDIGADEADTAKQKMRGNLKMRGSVQFR